MTAGVTMTAKPVEAASLTGTLQFNGALQFDKLINPSKITFLDANPAASGINFSINQAATDLAFGTEAAGKVSGNGKITPASLNLVGGSATGTPIANFISGLSIFDDTTSTTKALSFNLKSFSLGAANVTSVGTFTNVAYTSALSGTFFAGETFLGEGLLTSQFSVLTRRFNPNAAANLAYSGSLAAAPIPTPALLPGLLGLSAAALRKRKGEQSEREQVKA